jgi:Protein of unknown function (DUF3365)
MDRLKTVLLATGVAAAVVATFGASNGPAEWPIGRAPAALRPAISRADLVIADAHGAFLRELRAKLAKGGPLLALGVCHMTPQLLMRQLHRRDGIAAGFTSDRLRDPANAPPAWAAGLIARHAGQPADAIDGFAVDLGPRVGVLRPIAEQSLCTTCHGPTERLDPQIRRELARRYTTDRATGFNPGEIRGWYWVEIAKED